MPLPPRLDTSLKRLASALDQLDAAASRRAQADESRSNLDEELSVMQDDRSRLAVELDAALARTRALALTNDEARERLTKTAATLRLVLGAQQASSGEGGTA